MREINQIGKEVSYLFKMGSSRDIKRLSLTLMGNLIHWLPKC